MPLQRTRHVFATRHQRQRVITGEGIRQKSIDIKDWMHRRHHTRNGLGHVGAILGNKGFGHSGLCFALRWGLGQLERG